VDADVPNSKRVLYIGTDNFKAGRESMKRMAALISGRGKHRGRHHSGTGKIWTIGWPEWPTR